MAPEGQTTTQTLALTTLVYKISHKRPIMPRRISPLTPAPTTCMINASGGFTECTEENTAYIRQGLQRSTPMLVRFRPSELPQDAEITLPLPDRNAVYYVTPDKTSETVQEFIEYLNLPMIVDTLYGEDIMPESTRGMLIG
ncbi:hypothetical protein V866_001839 [Kwoniella sp. B9012]